jgi:hypothetical protein
METEHILTLLVHERDKLNRVIDILQGTKQRGLPPKNAVPIIVSSENGGKKTRTFSTAQRKKQAARMKAYWAAKKKSEK